MRGHYTDTTEIESITEYYYEQSYAKELDKLEKKNKFPKT